MADTQKSLKCLSYCLKVLEQNKKLIEASQTANSVAIIKAFKAGLDSARQVKEQPFNVVGRQMTKAMLRASRGANAMVFSALFKGATDFLPEDLTFDVKTLHELTEHGLDEMKLTCERLNIEPSEMPLIKTVQSCLQIYLMDDSLDFIAYVIELQKRCISHALKPNVDPDNYTAEDILDADSFCFCLFWHAALEFSKQMTLDELNIIDTNERYQELEPPSNFTYQVEFTIIRKNGLTIELLKRSLLSTGKPMSLTQENNTFKLKMLSNTPHHIISYSLKFGELTDVQIINLKII